MMKISFIILIGLLALTFTDCDKGKDSPSTTTSDCNCEDPASFMTVVVSSAPTTSEYFEYGVLPLHCSLTLLSKNISV
jgi:hypothetical protein